MYRNVKKINIIQIRSTNSPNERYLCNISDKNKHTVKANDRPITCPTDGRTRLPHPKLPPRPNTNQESTSGTLSEAQVSCSVRSAIPAF
jgi:uncharacterized Zn-finger protein